MAETESKKAKKGAEPEADAPKAAKAAKGAAKAAEAPPEPVAVPDGKEARPAKAGLLTWLLILVLTGILAALVLALSFVFDYLGVIDLRRHLPESVRRNPAVRDYLDEASLIAASDEEKVRFYRQRMEIEFERAQQEIKRREFQLEHRRDEIDRREKATREDLALRQKALAEEESRLKSLYQAKLDDLATREVSLRSREIEFGVKLDALLDTSEAQLAERVESLAKVYERMEPLVAADNLSRVAPEIALQVLLTIQPRKSARILERMNPEASAKFFEAMSPEQARRLKAP